MSQEPDFNTDHPTTLFAEGRLGGKAIGFDLSTSRPLARQSGIFIGKRRNFSKGERKDAPQLVAVKSIVEDGSRIPRSGKKEAKLLEKLDHPNIIDLLNAYLYPPTSTCPYETVRIFTPFHPYTLRQLLDSPNFVPSPSQPTEFTSLSDSIAAQLVSATAYLHSKTIGHRDINPSNVVISSRGQALLIDFGIAVEPNDEKSGEQHFEVGTGPYRAPELVFASKAYYPPSIDLWALAATIAEMFRPFSRPRSLSPEDEYWSSGGPGYTPSPSPPPEPKRESLFKSDSSDFVLAASMFKVVGTPTLATWPEARELPNFGYFSFASFPPTRLESHLPHLDPSSPLFEVLESMLKCSASERMTAQAAEKRLASSVKDASKANFEEYLSTMLKVSSSSNDYLD